jgi:uncharacterized protein DUF6886
MPPFERGFDQPPFLYHFSEEPRIARFEPRVAPTSSSAEPLVWAVDPAKSYLYLFPRDCPRVMFYIAGDTSETDRERFFAHTDATRVVAIESGWLDRMRSAALYRYEFDSNGFELLDEGAGYWVSRSAVEPVSVERVGDLLTALAADGVDLRITPSLWPLYEAVVASTLGFSIIRFRNAAPKESGTDL